MNKTSYFNDDTPVYFNIKVSGTPNTLGTIDHKIKDLFYGEVNYYNPVKNTYIIVWFSHKYESSLQAYTDCYRKMQEYIEKYSTIII